MKTFKFALILVVSLVICISNVYAIDFGINKTIWDNKSTSGWYGSQEDNEVEPGMIANQNWDLEGFFLKNNNLTIVAGFDLKDGYTYNSKTYTSGDIFIDSNGGAQYGDFSGSPLPTYGYEYVLDMNYVTKTYTVYLLNSNPILLTVNEPLNVPDSNPYKFVSGGTVVAGYQDVAFSYFDNLTNADTGLQGYSGNNYHNALTVNIGFLPGGTTFTSHFTITCGNDNLMGQGTTVVPEPATLLLLGLSLVGIGVFSRKLRK
jgi:hypothetical protein